MCSGNDLMNLGLDPAVKSHLPCTNFFKAIPFRPNRIEMAYRMLTSTLLCRTNYTVRLRMPRLVGLRALTTPGLQVDILAPRIQDYIRKQAKVCRPDQIYVCNGSEEESKALLSKLQQDGRFQKLPKYENCYYARTDPKDVARVEKQTYVCSQKKSDTVPTPKEGVVSSLGNWRDPADMDEELDRKFAGCMRGRTMYVIPYSMGPIGSPLSKIGVQLTDSEYVVASMRIMSRMGEAVLDVLKDDEFVQCLHSVGVPLRQGEDDVPWPCNPKEIAVAHFPERNEIKSFGSGYGGNSLLGKKCFALRIANTLAKREGWLAEHMLIVGLTNPQGRKRYIAAAFPSACGKTNLAMLTPPIPGWKVECIGDDIAWMKVGKDGRFYAINPENGFFGVAPGTSRSSNPSAMDTIFKNTVFTNTARTSDGGVYWEGMEEPAPGISITSWLGVEDWEKLPEEERRNKPASHANARFCTPISQYPHLDPKWEDSEGVPIDAILFGGRRPTTIPLVYEAYNWKHGVLIGAGMKSEATAAAADVKHGTIPHDPFAMRPFFGYNFSQYLHHWLDMESRPGIKLPKIFHVNWFRKDDKGKFVWPGFGENLRVLDWILRRCDGEDCAKETPLGYVPSSKALNLDGLKEGSVKKGWLFKMDKEELMADLEETEQYFSMQVPGQLPEPVVRELEALKDRIKNN